MHPHPETLFAPKAAAFPSPRRAAAKPRLSHTGRAGERLEPRPPRDGLDGKKQVWPLGKSDLQGPQLVRQHPGLGRNVALWSIIPDGLNLCFPAEQAVALSPYHRSGSRRVGFPPNSNCPSPAQDAERTWLPRQRGLLLLPGDSWPPLLLPQLPVPLPGRLSTGRQPCHRHRRCHRHTLGAEVAPVAAPAAPSCRFWGGTGQGHAITKRVRTRKIQQMLWLSWDEQLQVSSIIFGGLISDSPTQHAVANPIPALPLRKSSRRSHDVTSWLLALRAAPHSQKMVETLHKIFYNVNKTTPNVGHRAMSTISTCSIS